MSWGIALVELGLMAHLTECHTWQHCHPWPGVREACLIIGLICLVHVCWRRILTVATCTYIPSCSINNLYFQHGRYFANQMQVSKLYMHCKRKCGWKGSWAKMKDHLKECGLEKKGKARGIGWEGERTNVCILCMKCPLFVESGHWFVTMSCILSFPRWGVGSRRWSLGRRWCRRVHDIDHRAHHDHYPPSH